MCESPPSLVSFPTLKSDLPANLGSSAGYEKAPNCTFVCFPGKFEYFFMFTDHLGYFFYEFLILILCSFFWVTFFLLIRGSLYILATEIWWTCILQMSLSSPWFVFAFCQHLCPTENCNFNVIFINIFLYGFVHFPCRLSSSSLLGSHKDTCLLFFSLTVLKFSFSHLVLYSRWNFLCVKLDVEVLPPYTQ